jgi:hypothetical protein
MEVLWSALGICALVCFVLYILALRWQRVLRQQTWLVRKLSERVKALEEISDPQFRQRVGESSPMPLERVFNFSFRLSERFWRGTLRLTDEGWEFVRRFGSFVGSLKLECWRSHTVATITEVLPASNTVQWQKRSLDFYADETEGDAPALWELRLALPNESAERPPSLELLLRKDAIELRGHLQAAERWDQECRPAGQDDITFFRVPLNTAQLAEFRSQEPMGAGDSSRNATSNGGKPEAGSWRAFYSAADEGVGFEWQLCVRDLTRKAEWDRWGSLEPVEMGGASRGRQH